MAMGPDNDVRCVAQKVTRLKQPKTIFANLRTTFSAAQELRIYKCLLSEMFYQLF